MEDSGVVCSDNERVVKKVFMIVGMMGIREIIF